VALYDEVGYWSEIKLDIVKDYAKAYSTILAAQKAPALYHVYIDAFAGAGQHISRSTGEFIPGSPLNALLVSPPFREYYLIDIKAEKVDALEALAAEKPNVHVLQGDCNKRLLVDVFPNVLWENYRRALCVLDPYGLDLAWEVMTTAGKMRSIEVFVNFPVMDMNRNVLWRNPEGVSKDQTARLTRFWGDDSWRRIAYVRTQTLFGEEDEKVSRSNDAIASAFKERLRNVAGFKHVAEPLAMRNSQGATVYYLFFASHKPVAEDIVGDIFAKYYDRGL
jgi:three-Cys-motif partner protein